MVERTLQAAGINVVTGCTVEEIVGMEKERVATVVLNDGRRIECQAVIAAIGVLPRTDLVTGTAVRTNRGIVVDRHMTTSCSDIYACGDAAEAYDFLRGEEKLTPIWPNAYAGGRIAGLNMAGRPVVYEGTTNMNSFNYFGLPIISAGIVEPPDMSSYKVLQSPLTNGGAYQRIVLQDNRVVGMVFVGDIQSAGIVIGLMRNKTDVRGFQRPLVSSGLSLASLPRELRQAMLAQAMPTAV
jgi:NAD(P)H-nitrite reductase large subunit